MAQCGWASRCRSATRKFNLAAGNASFDFQTGRNHAAEIRRGIGRPQGRNRGIPTPIARPFGSMRPRIGFAPFGAGFIMQTWKRNPMRATNETRKPTATPNGKTAGKTATNNGGAKGAANTTKGDGLRRRFNAKSDRSDRRGRGGFLFSRKRRMPLRPVLVQVRGCF